jgi:hypothetical protein
VIARALAPHRGFLFYRGFVYDHRMDWRNPMNDRARAAYDNFKTLDGRFDPNVVLQIKHGPIDFQVREPASPLFGALETTSQAVELQITQEYLGQQRHVCFVVPLRGVRRRPAGRCVGRRRRFWVTEPERPYVHAANTPTGQPCGGRRDPHRGAARPHRQRRARLHRDRSCPALRRSDPRPVDNPTSPVTRT